MFLLLRSRGWLSSSQNYVNTFKVRSRLADFFKHIHPDQMVQAPTKIKDQNLRSLKNFNSYLDAVNQQKPIDGKLLKFYISEKTNLKSRKFFSFNLELPQLDAEQAQLTEDKAGKLIDDIVNALNSKFKESRGMLEGKKKEKDKVVLEPEIRVESEEEKVQRRQETVGPFMRSNHNKTIEEERLKKAINAKYMENEREDLKLKLRKNMSFANTSTNKPMMWSRILMNESGIYNDYQQILNHLIDPKLIYFSPDMDLPHIEQFKKKLLPGELDRLGVRATQAVLEVCEQMEEYAPPVCLYVTTHYSSSEIPGFFSIPFDFSPIEMREQWKKSRDAIISERVKYEQYYDYFEDLRKELSNNRNFKVNRPEFSNNQDISAKIQVLQRLKKHSLDRPTEVNILEADEGRILCQEYKLDNTLTVHYLKGRVFITPAFQEEHLSSVVERINSASKGTFSQAI